jgi:hypothetical protein
MRSLANHGTDNRYTSGCRCEPCTVAHAEYHREYYRRNRDKLNARKRETRKRNPRVLRPCGTSASYQRGCRCARCVHAAKTERRARKLDKNPNARGPAVHPSRTTYDRGCRCEGCKAAKSASMRDYYRRLASGDVRGRGVQKLGGERGKTAHESSSHDRSSEGGGCGDA